MNKCMFSRSLAETALALFLRDELSEQPGTGHHPPDLDVLGIRVSATAHGAQAVEQSAVSRRIAALEQQAGGPLFERLPRGVRLNPAGRALHRHAVEVIDRLSRAERELAVLHAGHGGLLHMGAFATANISLVPTALRALQDARPDVEVVAVEGPTDTLIGRLADGALDLAVVSDYPSGLPSADGVTTTVLCEDELFVTIPRGHRLAGAGAVDLRELHDEAWLQNTYGDRPTMLADACARRASPPGRSSGSRSGPGSSATRPLGWEWHWSPHWPPGRSPTNWSCAASPTPPYAAPSTWRRPPPRSQRHCNCGTCCATPYTGRPSATPPRCNPQQSAAERRIGSESAVSGTAALPPALLLARLRPARVQHLAHRAGDSSGARFWRRFAADVGHLVAEYRHRFARAAAERLREGGCAP